MAEGAGDGGKPVDASPPSLDQLFELWRHRDRLRVRPSGGILHDASLSGAEAAAMLPRDPDALALLVAPGGTILAASAAAAGRVPGLLRGALERLPFDAGDTAKLHLALYQALSSPSGAAITLRARSIRSESMKLLRVSAQAGAAAHPRLGRIEVVEACWPPELVDRLLANFGFDLGQEALLRALATGETLEEIALHHGLSRAEVGEAITALLRQSGSPDLPELLQLVFGLLEAPQPDHPPLPPRGWSPGLRGGRPDDSHLMLADGRGLEWLEYGAPGGRPVLYMHFSYGLTRWSARAIRAARQRGLRILVPLRPGYGATSRLPAGTPWREGVVADYARLCDHLGLQSVQVVTQGADLRLALALAEARPDIVAAVLGCAAQLPLATHSQFERMGKWQRFVLRNARFAPDVLPSVVKSAFAMLRNLGIEDMLRLLNASSPADLAALGTPEIREAILSGMSHALPSDPEIGPAILAEECLDSERDWSDLLQRAKVPLRLMQADQDPLSPLQTLQELLEDFPKLDVRLLEGTGQFLLYQRWQEILDAIEDLARPAA